MKKHSEKDAKEILSKSKSLGVQAPQPGRRLVRSYFFGLKESPSEVKTDSPEGVVFYNLCACYKNAKNVSEGKIGDVIWGFRQSGIPNKITWDGFNTLKKLGYLQFTDPQGVMIIGEGNEKCWFKWTSKFFDLLLDSADPSIEQVKDDKIKDVKAEEL